MLSRVWGAPGAAEAEAAAGLGDVQCLSETPTSTALKQAITTCKVPAALSAKLRLVHQESWHYHPHADGEQMLREVDVTCQKLRTLLGEQGNPHLCFDALAYRITE